MLAVLVSVIAVSGYAVTHAQVPAPTVTFTVNRASDNPSATGVSISPTDLAYINWAAVNADGCNASGDPTGMWSGPKSVTQTTQATTIVGPLALGAHTYTITCNGGGGITTKSITINVLPLSELMPVVALSASPTSVDDGGSTTLTWSATNANSCSLSNWKVNGLTTDGTSGTQVVGPLAGSQSPYVFGLTCYGYYGNGSNSVTVTAASAPILIKRAGAGEFCGGIAAIQCASGYSCALVSPGADAGGTCVSASPAPQPTPTPTTPSDNTGATLQQQLIQLITKLLQLVQQYTAEGLLTTNQALAILNAIPIFH